MKMMKNRVLDRMKVMMEKKNLVMNRMKIMMKVMMQTIVMTEKNLVMI